MTPQHVSQRCDVFRCLKGIEIVRIFAELDARRSKRLQAFAITQAYAAPVVTLQQDERAGKNISGVPRCIAAEAEDFRKLQHVNS